MVPRLQRYTFTVCVRIFGCKYVYKKSRSTSQKATLKLVNKTLKVQRGHSGYGLRWNIKDKRSAPLAYQQLWKEWKWVSLHKDKYWRNRNSCFYWFQLKAEKRAPTLPDRIWHIWEPAGVKSAKKSVKSRNWWTFSAWRRSGKRKKPEFKGQRSEGVTWRLSDPAPSIFPRILRLGTV